MAEETLVRVENLQFSYPGGEVPAVDQLALQVAAGDFFGLLGPNGAGKTTTISILCSLLKPSAGRVEIAGFDSLRNKQRLRHLIGLVPQEIALYGSLSVVENLKYFGRLYGMSGTELKQRIPQCLDLVGLQERAEDPVATFSGGMKRRANLAVGVLHNPRILFLDEPTVGIDAQSRNLILENLKKLNAAGMTMVYTSHYMEEVAQLCNRLQIIDHGQAIAEGAPAALLAEHRDCTDLEALFLKLTGRQLRD